MLTRGVGSDKFNRLRAMLEGMGSVLVAYSGGLDSTFLLAAALQVLGNKNVLAVNALSETYPASEARAAHKIAKQLGARLLKIPSGELANPKFVKNPVDRCYHCKKELFSRLLAVARKNGLAQVVDGSNVDDLSDYRPGVRAAHELGIRSPLKEVGITKADIRRFSKAMKLPTWDKPSYACLASRFPYGVKITKDVLRRLDEGENYLRKLGFRQVRARHYGQRVQIEVDKTAVRRACRMLDKISRKFKRLGYVEIEIDRRGYRTGSMNEGVAK
jgi:uncharacterized protein